MSKNLLPIGEALEGVGVAVACVQQPKKNHPMRRATARLLRPRSGIAHGY
jgi:hypothetical protein